MSHEELDDTIARAASAFSAQRGIATIAELEILIYGPKKNCWLCRGLMERPDNNACLHCRVFQLDNLKLRNIFVQTIINAFKTLRSCHK
jgi:hypothetical protein